LWKIHHSYKRITAATPFPAADDETPSAPPAPLLRKPVE
jgi:hypothetical protein